MKPIPLWPFIIVLLLAREDGCSALHHAHGVKQDVSCLGLPSSSLTQRTSSENPTQKNAISWRNSALTVRGGGMVELDGAAILAAQTTAVVLMAQSLVAGLKPLVVSRLYGVQQLDEDEEEDNRYLLRETAQVAGLVGATCGLHLFGKMAPRRSIGVALFGFFAVNFWKLMKDRHRSDIGLPKFLFWMDLAVVAATSVLVMTQQSTAAVDSYIRQMAIWSIVKAAILHTKSYTPANRQSPARCLNRITAHNWLSYAVLLLAYLHPKTTFENAMGWMSASYVLLTLAHIFGTSDYANNNIPVAPALPWMVLFTITAITNLLPSTVFHSKYAE